MGGRGIRNLKARVGRECCFRRGARWGRLNSGGIQAGEFRGGSHSVVSKKAGGQLQE